MSKIRDWWKKLKYWQKAGTIGLTIFLITITMDYYFFESKDLMNGFIAFVILFRGLGFGLIGAYLSYFIVKRNKK
ncbi:hypothetical protein J4212_02335 [Candidatus Woesearchaeota archaeon]|nr:hypothetical protein [Candidatus Woesearchaeota archaeon]